MTSDLVTSELHKPFHKPKVFSKVVTGGKDDIWSIDLVDMTDVNADSGYRYILTCIDCFTRFAWAVPIKGKTAEASWAAFDSILKSSDRKPNKIWADQGSEFFNEVWEKERNKLDIDLYYTSNVKKAVMIERFNRTLKTWMWLKFTKQGNHKWLKILPSLMKKYNHKNHSSIGMSPDLASRVSNKILKSLAKAQYSDAIGKIGKPKFALHDWVREAVVKGKFDKGYTANWSEELYQIVGIDLNEPIKYQLADINGDYVDGKKYESEIKKTKQSMKSYLKKVTGEGKAPEGDYVVKVLSWRINPKSKARFDKYLLKVEHKLGSVDEIPLGRYVGIGIKGKFKEDSRKPDQILEPIKSFVMKDATLRKEVWDKYF